MTSTIRSCADFEQIYLAFDIHDVLAQQQADEISAPLFQAYGMLLQVPVQGHSKPIRHYVYPFVKELFQLLTETTGVNIAFFTSSKGSFARPFVKQLLIRCVGEEKFCKIADKVHICAREQLRRGNSYSSNLSMFGNNAKDLDDVYPDSNIPKRQRILVEDDVSFAAPHQGENLLHISGDGWTEELDSYQRLGEMLSIFPSYKKFKKSQKYTKSDEESLALVLKKGLNKEEDLCTFVVIYHDKEGKKKLKLNPEESRKIGELYEKSVRERIEYFSEKYSSGESRKEIVNEIKKTGLETVLHSDSKRICICGEEVRAEECVRQALNGDLIIHFRGDDANIYLPQNPQEAISLKERGFLKLLELSRKYWESRCKNEDHFFKESDKKTSTAQLYDRVWEKVKNLVRKDKIIYRANHILLLTGALFKAWEESKMTQKPLSDILFSWQSEENKQFEPGILQKRTELYLQGLEMLRKVNPQLKPVTIKSFEDALEKYPHLPDDGSEEYEGGGCVIS